MIFKDRDITEREHYLLGLLTAIASVVLAISAAFGNLTDSVMWTVVGILVALLGCMSLLDHLKKVMNSTTGVALAVIVFMLIVVAANFLGLGSI